MHTKRLGRWARLSVMIGGLLMTCAQPAISPARQKSGDEAARLFAYDRSAPLDMREESSKVVGGVAVKDLSYAAHTPGRGRAKAYLVSPGGAGPFAGVVFFHWYGKPDGNREQFVGEAVALAKRGVVSLLMQGYFPWSQPPTDAAADRRRVVDQTIEVRRAIDLLLAQRGVDPRRLGFVGHDYGAMYGTLAAAAEERVRAYALVAGIGDFGNWSLKYWLGKFDDSNTAECPSLRPGYLSRYDH